MEPLPELADPWPGVMPITKTSADWALLHTPLQPPLPTRELWHYWGPGIIAHTGPLLWRSPNSPVPIITPAANFSRRAECVALPGLLRGLKHFPELSDSFGMEQNFS